MTEFCGSPRLTQALQYVQWHETNIMNNQNARFLALEDAVQIQAWAKATAFSCSVLFLICVTFLAAAITYRVVQSRNLALALGGLYFLFFGFILVISREPLNAVTTDFRIEANTIEARNIPTDLPGPESLREAMTLISREQTRVPELFHEMSTHLPQKGRWWTLGWDEVGLIHFQNEAFRALIRKGNFGLRTVIQIRENLQRKCRESGLQI